ncbi:zinc finger protein 184-like [Gigantopelta aegis]|uniref:zinc finger protein 184-like n=1 Tax=Gigantopelta aegis TaxID=1735272 RepID=UPI001B889B7C|nr:zinc finger protein 184-like [Gigantopelta aegis]XP_041371884.1 zinc finger protein 184-like [Gigantopelta aegis]
MPNMDPAQDEEKMLRCSVCSRTFSFPETLANHQLMHETPVKAKASHNKQKAKRVHKTQARTEGHHPYIRRQSPEKIVPDKSLAVGQTVSHEVVIGDISSPTWTYHVEPPKREADLTKDGVRYSSENISWPYNPEYFKRFTEPTKPAHPNVFIPSRMTWCYNEPSAKAYQQNVPVMSHCDDITWPSNKIDDSKEPIGYQETIPLTAASNQTSNTVVSAPFSTANQTLSTAVNTSAPAQLLPSPKPYIAVQFQSKEESRDVAQQENPTKTSLSSAGNDEVSDNDKLYRCGLCWKTFSYLETFSNHMLGHRERAFCLCNVCGKEFDYLPNLDAHVTSHKPYRCISCDQRFRLWKCAKEHAQNHAVHDGGILEDYISYVS